MAQKKPVHILRYGTVAEKVHLEKAVSAYDYLSINGNTAAYVSSAIAKFVVAKFFSRPEKGFFIDPITYAFQNEIRLLRTTSKATGEESIKKSVQKLMEIGDELQRNDGIAVMPDQSKPPSAFRTGDDEFRIIDFFQRFNRDQF